ncbi:MAG: hypothetical protein LBQ15_07030 [Clostridium sp.]|nr:hypothetical protein [Clostridium sp.]
MDMILAAGFAMQGIDFGARMGVAAAILSVGSLAVLIMRRRKRARLAGPASTETSGGIIMVNGGVCVPVKGGNPGISFGRTLAYPEAVSIREGGMDEDR